MKGNSPESRTASSNKMKTYRPKISPDGKSYLNIGCGNRFFADWNNLDLASREGVIRCDIRKGLPFPDGSFDCAYSSHVLEHMDSSEGKKLLLEARRVLKPGGILRLAVPDLEGICREYIRNLDKCRENPNETNLFRYKWIKLELLDQMTRRTTGGEMRKVLDSNIPDKDYLFRRIGDAAEKREEKASAGVSSKGFFSKMVGKIRQSFSRAYDPAKAGELHRHMHDSLSLGLALKDAGFEIIGPKPFDKSEITGWSERNLDESTVSKGRPRKPDSLYFEARKP